MIIRNEKDRLKAWALLRDAELPCEVNINHIIDGADIVIPEPNPVEYEYPDTPEPTLGDHTSGMEDCCE